MDKIMGMAKKINFSYKQVQTLVPARICHTTEVNEMPNAQPEQSLQKSDL